MNASNPSSSVVKLARVYRLLLRAYPRSWRRVYGDEVAAVLLELAHDRGQARPDLREGASLVGNGLLMRVEELFALWSWRARQRAAVLAAVVVGGVGMLALVVAEFIPWRAGVPLAGPTPNFPWVQDDLLGPMPLTAGLGALPAAASIIGVLLVVLGRARVAQGVFAMTAGLTALLPLVASVTGVHRPPLFHLGFTFGLLLVAAAAPTRLGPSARRAIIWVMAALGAAVVAMAVHTEGLLGLVQQFYYQPPDDLFMFSWLGVGFSLSALVVVLVVPRLHGWVAPLVMVSVGWWVQALYLGGALPSNLRSVSPLGFLATCAVVTAAIGAASRLSQTYTLTVEKTHH